MQSANGTMEIRMPVNDMQRLDLSGKNTIRLDTRLCVDHTLNNHRGCYLTWFDNSLMGSHNPLRRKVIKDLEGNDDLIYEVKQNGELVAIFDSPQNAQIYCELHPNCVVFINESLDKLMNDDNAGRV